VIKTFTRDISRGELYLADEIFLSGTAAEITPIVFVDHKKVGSGKVERITKRIMSEYTNIVMNKNQKYSQWLTAVY
jgi:branched-chain amino acid aminotransferase